MESSESPQPLLPECPVCLQPYDGSDTVPRVLPCGHTACESCLLHLPQKFPQTIRCPGCTQLVKFPSPQGPRSLPKNIDLLRLCDSSDDSKRRPQEENRSSTSSNGFEGPSDSRQRAQKQFFTDLWTAELYNTWKDWILPAEAVSAQDGGMVVGSDDYGCLCMHRRFIDNQEVSLVPVFPLASGNDKAFRFSYVAQIMNSLSKMEVDLINELTLILKSAMKQHKICEIYGLWGDTESGVCYLASQRHKAEVFESSANWSDGFVVVDGDGLRMDTMSSFAMMAMEICETGISIHGEELVVGCLGLSCIDLDDFGHVRIDFNEILLMGREVSAAIAEFINDRKILDNKDIGVIFDKLLRTGIFASPELLFALLKKKQMIIGDNIITVYPIGYCSDVWVIGCVLIRLLTGIAFTKETWRMSDEDNVDFSTIHAKWLDSVLSLLETKLCTDFVKLRDILCQCLSLDPSNRPLLADLWKFMRELLTKHHFINVKNKNVTNKITGGHCLFLGKLCQMVPKVSDTSKEDDLHGICSESNDQAGNGDLEEDFVKSLSQEKVKCKELHGHLDCITALAVGGGFMFSTSYDKTICVWSLQDSSHVHTFRGHENKIMAVVYVHEGQPVCVTADGGGGIFVWNASSPFGHEPLKKWYEQKDWRYSGIHAIAYSTNGCLYTGSGDKLIKAWSLQECTLLCSMEGHRSVVSSLVVSNGVLYSGSWDGTIRLWCLSDHSPLAILGGDVPGKATSVLSVTVEEDLLVSVHENGSIKVWQNDIYMKCAQVQNGSIFAVDLEGKWLFTGGWDRTINIQEFSDDEHHVDIRPVGSISCGSVITSLLSWNRKLFVGCADRSIKVYYTEK